jgi:hypothetical protein
VAPINCQLIEATNLAFLVAYPWHLVSSQGELVGEISAAYTFSDRGLRLKCVESEKKPVQSVQSLLPLSQNRPQLRRSQTIEENHTATRIDASERSFFLFAECTLACAISL